MCSIFAVQFIGLAVGQGVWSGSGMLVSFLWGALYFKEPLTNPGLAALAIIVLLLATVGVGSAPIGPVPRLIRKLRGIPEPAPTIDTETTQTTTGAPSPDDPESLPLMRVNKPDSDQGPVNVSHSDGVFIKDEVMVQRAPVEQFGPKGRMRTVAGLMFAVALGLFNGALMVPLKLTPPEAQGIVWSVSFGIGVLPVTIVLSTLWFVARRQVPQFHFRAAFVPAFVCGIFWNIANIGSVYATLNLDMTIGFPLTQAALLVSGLWGLFFYRELKGLGNIAQFVASSLLLVGGAVLLGLFG
eukprot:TRINITY_DN5956_c0_g2_i1.p1 TRINITY_DN5956_c0_g2~~TRINITY_DN5956_c0_g2_i1.p1  ORF type:complete len:298 (-),score=78.00 TRINITY_DN5956_c0_g2_i1:151-1044(-)